jgi:hypothetical protein
MKPLTVSITNKLYNELETNLYNALYWNTKADAYNKLQIYLDSSLYIELIRKLNETIDNNLFDEL